MSTPRKLIIGVDVGSTTVKLCVVHPETLEILWSKYERHETSEPEKTLEMLTLIKEAFPEVKDKDFRLFITGSGGGPIAPQLGAKFVQEVNAVTMAVEKLHPDVGSVIELGGQDAKIIMFKKNEETGDKTAQTSMNDKCASGTGATIDKCMIKVGMPELEVDRLAFDPTRLHHVAAKCGVFAETDIVNLIKSGIPSPEIMCSLADAIVMQNLSVLTRGNTLRPKVLLLGGPNTYLPMLQQCWDPYPFWHQAEATGGQNYSQWDNRTASEYIENARTLADFTDRARLYRNFQVIFAKELPSLPLYYPVYSYGVDAQVRGVQVASLYDRSDRFSLIGNWYLVTRRILQQTPEVTALP